MGANAAGTVQEAHHGVEWRRKDFRAASHPCCQRLSDGIPLQTVTGLLCELLAVLFFISVGPFLPSNSQSERWSKSVPNVLKVKTAFPLLPTTPAPCFELKLEEEAVSSLTGFTHRISTYLTSRDSTPTCTWKGQLLVLRTHEELENAALRENYRRNGAITERKLEGSAGACLWPLKAQKYLKVDCGTMKASTEWTYRNIRGWRRVRLKPPQSLVPEGFTFVADLNTLMLFKVYITHECLPALMAQYRLALESSEVMQSGVKLYCM